MSPFYVEKHSASVRYRTLGQLFWLNSVLRPGVGIKAPHSTKATRHPRSLTPAQEKQVFRWINGRDPRQYGVRAIATHAKAEGAEIFLWDESGFRAE